MKVLIACEESQTVCKAFRQLSHEAYSCDIQEPSGGHPEWHILGDAIAALNGGVITTMDGKQHDVGKWDLLIAHPPCTYITAASAVELSKHQERLQKGLDGAAFLLSFLRADCPRICVENPPPMKRFGLPKYTQLVRAYQIGENHTKAYCLWLKGLPPLTVDTTAEKPKAEYQWIHKATGKKKSASRFYNSDTRNHRVARSKTPEGLADAMAEQWGGLDNE